MADYVCITNHDESVNIGTIETMPLFDGNSSKESRFFQHRHIRYVIANGIVAAIEFAFEKQLSNIFLKKVKIDES